MQSNTLIHATHIECNKDSISVILEQTDPFLTLWDQKIDVVVKEALHCTDPKNHLNLLKHLALDIARNKGIAAAKDVLDLTPPNDRLAVLLNLAFNIALKKGTAAAKGALDFASSPTDRLDLLEDLAINIALHKGTAAAKDVLDLTPPNDRLAVLKNLAFSIALEKGTAAAKDVLDLTLPNDRLAVLKNLAFDIALEKGAAATNEIFELAQSQEQKLPLSIMIAYGLPERHNLAAANKSTLGQMLVKFKPCFREMMATALLPLTNLNTKVTVADLVSEANKIDILMTTYQLDSLSASAWIAHGESLFASRTRNHQPIITSIENNAPTGSATRDEKNLGIRKRSNIGCGKSFS